MSHFSPDLQPALELVLADCKGANGHLSAATVHETDARDVAIIQAAMKQQGVELAFGEAYHLWSLVSLDCQENWSTVSSEADVRIAVNILCEHVRDGIDYAGISDPDR